MFIENKNSRFSDPENFSLYLHSIDLSLQQIQNYIKRKFSDVRLQYPNEKPKA